jgi:hypothetical protein
VAGESEIKKLSPEQLVLLVGLFDVEAVRKDDRDYVVARFGGDIFAVWGDWSNDGTGYWEACSHCYAKVVPGFDNCKKGG